MCGGSSDGLWRRGRKAMRLLYAVQGLEPGGGVAQNRDDACLYIVLVSIWKMQISCLLRSGIDICRYSRSIFMWACRYWNGNVWSNKYLGDCAYCTLLVTMTSIVSCMFAKGSETRIQEHKFCVVQPAEIPRNVPREGGNRNRN